ncbi:hypothetical protein [Photorhabdus sp. RW14-46]|nr:hypothetical protein [Photorhabdus sp. RW14-46]
MTGVSERSQQRGNLKDNGYIYLYPMDFKTASRRQGSESPEA